VVGGGTVVTVAVGQAQGVANNWSVTIGPHLPCKIVRVDPHTTRAECRGTPDQVKATPFALLCAP
jgi:hypothetical protein